MNAPRYAVYMMLDEPHGNKKTYGYATAGWVVAPAAGKVIARIGPMLGMLPDLQDMPAINQALAIPLQPARPPGITARGPVVASTTPGAPGGRPAADSACAQLHCPGQGATRSIDPRPAGPDRTPLDGHPDNPAAGDHAAGAEHQTGHSLAAISADRACDGGLGGGRRC